MHLYVKGENAHVLQTDFKLLCFLQMPTRFMVPKGRESVQPMSRCEIPNFA